MSIFFYDFHIMYIFHTIFFLILNCVYFFFRNSLGFKRIGLKTNQSSAVSLYNIWSPSVVLDKSSISFIV